MRSEMSAIENWETQSLRQLATINYGRSPAGILAEDGDYPVVGTGGSERRGKDFLYEGDSIILGRKGTIDRVHFATGRFWTIDTAYYLSEFGDSVPLWLFYFFQTLDLRQMNEATGVPSLSRDLLYKIEIPTPPKPEQTKIAEILSTVDRAIAQTEALIAKQQRLKTGLMQDLLTRGIDEHGNLRSEQTHEFKDSPLGRIPVEWDAVQVGNIIAGIDAGWSPSCEDVTPGQGEWGVLKVSAISSGVFNPSESKRLPTALRPIESLEVRPDDVLISRANGVTELVGRCVFVLQTPTKLMLSDKTLRLKPRLQKIEPFMLSVLLATQDARRQIMNFISGSSGQKNLSQKQIGSIEVALPSVEEQKRICSTISKASKQLEYHGVTAQKLRSLKTAMMQDLLTGRKRVTELLEA